MDRIGVKDVHDFRKMDEDELYKEMAACQSPGYYQLAVEELQRRYLRKVGEQVHTLVEATSQVHREVALLANSSSRMEDLTKVLRKFTIFLIIIGLIQIIVMGVQTWKIFRDVPAPASVSKPISTVAPPKSQSAGDSPQTFKTTADIAKLAWVNKRCRVWGADGDIDIDRTCVVVRTVRGSLVAIPNEYNDADLKEILDQMGRKTKDKWIQRFMDLGGGEK